MSLSLSASASFRFLAGVKSSFVCRVLLGGMMIVVETDVAESVCNKSSRVADIAKVWVMNCRQVIGLVKADATGGVDGIASPPSNIGCQ